MSQSIGPEYIEDKTDGDDLEEVESSSPFDVIPSWEKDSEPSTGWSHLRRYQCGTCSEICINPASIEAVDLSLCVPCFARHVGCYSSLHDPEVSPDCWLHLLKQRFSHTDDGAVDAPVDPVQYDVSRTDSDVPAPDDTDALWH